MKQGTHKDVITNVSSSNDSRIETYLSNLYGDKTNYKFLGNVETKILTSKNYSQSSVYNTFINQSGISTELVYASTVCSELADSILMRNYSEYKSEINTNHANINQIFNVAMIIAVNKGYYVHGTAGDKTDELVTDTFKFYKSSYKGSMKTKNLVDKVKDAVDNKEYMLFETPDHSMVSIGYSTYKYSYETTSGILWWKKTVTKEKTFDFIIVNDGWSNYYEYSYYSEDKLSGCNIVRVNK